MMSPYLGFCPQKSEVIARMEGNRNRSMSGDVESGGRSS